MTAFGTDVKYDLHVYTSEQSQLFANHRDSRQVQLHNNDGHQTDRNAADHEDVFESFAANLCSICFCTHFNGRVRQMTGTETRSWLRSLPTLQTRTNIITALTCVRSLTDTDPLV